MKLNTATYEIGYPVYDAKFLNGRTLLVTGGGRADDFQGSANMNRLTALTINFEKRKVIKRFRELKLPDDSDNPTVMDAENNVILVGCNESAQSIRANHNHSLQKFIYTNEHLKYLQSASLEDIAVPLQYQKFIRLSKDGKIAITATSKIPTVIHVLDADRVFEKYEIDTNNEVKDLDISPDGKLLAYVTQHTLEIISAVTGKSVDRKTDFKSSLSKCRFQDNDKVLVAANVKDQGGISLVRLSISKKLKVDKAQLISKKIKGITSLDANVKNGVIAVAGNDSSLTLLKMQSFKQIKVFTGVHELSVTKVVFSDDGKYLASVSASKTVHVISIPDALGIETHMIYNFFVRLLFVCLFGALLVASWLLYQYNQSDPMDISDYFTLVQKTQTEEPAYSTTAIESDFFTEESVRTLLERKSPKYTSVSTPFPVTLDELHAADNAEAEASESHNVIQEPELTEVAAGHSSGSSTPVPETSDVAFKPIEVETLSLPENPISTKPSQSLTRSLPSATLTATKKAPVVLQASRTMSTSLTASEVSSVSTADATRTAVSSVVKKKKSTKTKSKKKKTKKAKKASSTSESESESDSGLISLTTSVNYGSMEAPTLTRLSSVTLATTSLPPLTSTTHMPFMSTPSMTFASSIASTTSKSKKARISKRTASKKVKTLSITTTTASITEPGTIESPTSSVTGSNARKLNVEISSRATQQIIDPLDLDDGLKEELIQGMERLAEQGGAAPGVMDRLEEAVSIIGDYEAEITTVSEEVSTTISVVVAQETVLKEDDIKNAANKDHSTGNLDKAISLDVFSGHSVSTEETLGTASILDLPTEEPEAAPEDDVHVIPETPVKDMSEISEKDITSLPAEPSTDVEENVESIADMAESKTENGETDFVAEVDIDDEADSTEEDDSGDEDGTDGELDSGDAADSESGDESDSDDGDADGYDSSKTDDSAETVADFEEPSTSDDGHDEQDDFFYDPDSLTADDERSTQVDNDLATGSTISSTILSTGDHQGPQVSDAGVIPEAEEEGAVYDDDSSDQVSEKDGSGDSDGDETDIADHEVNTTETPAESIDEAAPEEDVDDESEDENTSEEVASDAEDEDETSEESGSYAEDQEMSQGELGNEHREEDQEDTGSSEFAEQRDREEDGSESVDDEDLEEFDKEEDQEKMDDESGEKDEEENGEAEEEEEIKEEESEEEVEEEAEEENVHDEL